MDAVRDVVRLLVVAALFGVEAGLDVAIRELHQPSVSDSEEVTCLDTNTP